MPIARHHAESAVGDKKLYVAGVRIGGEESTNLDPFNKYDLVIDRWATNLELMPLKKSGIEAASPSHISTAVAVASSCNNQSSDGNGHDHGGDGWKRCGGDNDGGEGNG